MINKGRVWIYLLACSVVLTPLQVRAVAEVDQADAEVVSASQPERIDPEQSIEDILREFYHGPIGSKLKARDAAGELFVSDGKSEIKVGPENAQWGKHRTTAYENALIQAENEIVRRRGLKLQAEKLREYFSDTDRPVPDFQPDDLGDGGKFERIVSKLLSVAEGNLDKELDKLGVDKEEFKVAPEPQRHLMFREALTKTTTREATADLAGVMPIKTFEAHNSTGEHVIGVVVVQSEKMKQFAREIVNARGDIKPEKGEAGRPIYEVITENPKALVDEFGLRRLYDEDGYPVLVSFGQSANAYRGEDRRKQRRYREAAQKAAEASADSQITFFVAGKAHWTDENTMQELFEEAEKVHPNNYKESDNVLQVVNTVRENSRAKAKANITGLTTVYTWAMRYPLYPEQEVVGVVRMYSPKSERAARLMDHLTEKPKSAPKASISGQNGVRSSKDRMDVSDF